MHVSLSIKEVPDKLAAALRERARLHHRSLQGELMHILMSAVEQPKRFDIEGLVREVRKLGLSSSRNESAKMVRQMRDER